tara:strand:- start:1090 stop:1287 length:198 start_codon:yes stop_codon:yes gene_type:complete
MTDEHAEMLNRLFEIEDQIQELWTYHPENPDAVDIVIEFNELQREASTIESYLQEKGIELDENMF